METVRRWLLLNNAPLAYDRLVSPFDIARPLLLDYLGPDWFDSYVIPRDQVAAYLPGRLNDTDFNFHLHRLIELAELLYNCDGIDGFDDFIKRCKSERELEPIFAELRVAKLLICSGKAFRFVSPVQKKGADYDLEIQITGSLYAPADVKAKLEGSIISANTVLNSLNDARRRNLPRNRPGLIFLHIPQEWFIGEKRTAGENLQADLNRHTDELTTTLEAVIPSFFRNTSRVLGIILVSFVLIEFVEASKISQTILVKEFINPEHPDAEQIQIPILGSYAHCYPMWTSIHEEGQPERFEISKANLASR